MKNLLRILKYIWKHPLASKNRSLAFKKFFAWQLGQKLNTRPVFYPLVEDSSLLISKGMAGATGNIYTGLLEFDDMTFVLHFLRPGDIFADIGANVGVYTILASKNAGAKVLSVEPIPSTFSHLSNNVYLNKVTNLVNLMPYGVGEVASSLRFTNSMDAINHIVREDEKFDTTDTVEIPVKTIDELFEGQIPHLIKIDVEGFESPALNGAKTTLAAPTLKGIIIELNGCGRAYGYSEDTIHEYLISYGFKPYSYSPFTHELTSLNTYGNYNTIYLRDLDFVRERLKNSRKYTILGQSI